MTGRNSDPTLLPTDPDFMETPTGECASDHHPEGHHHYQHHGQEAHNRPERNSLRGLQEDLCDVPAAQTVGRVASVLHDGQQEQEPRQRDERGHTARGQVAIPQEGLLHIQPRNNADGRNQGIIGR